MADVNDYQKQVISSQSLKDIIRDEYKKCAQDPVYFMRKYCYIQHPKKGKMLFDLYPFQEQCLYDFRDHDRNIILKSRQLGISTLSAGYTLWLMIFHEDKNCLTIATRQEVARNLVTKVRVMYDNLPNWLKVNAQSTEDNKLSLRLTNGSQVKASSTSPSAGRSEAVSLLIIDEAAFIDTNTIEELWGGLQQTLATGGKCIMLSTPNGMGNFFHRMWQRAEEGSNNFNTIKLHWTVHPDRDQAWRDAQSAELGEKLAAQECDCLWGESTITIRDSITGEIQNITLADLYNKLEHSKYVKRGYIKIKNSIKDIIPYTKEDTRNKLIQNDFYLSLFGKSKNRTLIKLDPILYKSIYEHTKILEDVMKSQNSYKRSYCFTSRIRFIVEYNYDLNKLKCECGKIYNFTKFCRACPDPKNTWTGRTHSQETLTKMRQSTINYIESCNGKCVPRYNKKSIEILNNIAKDLGITDLQHAENGGEYYIKELGYYLDGYSKSKNIVIEYDEPTHYDSKGILKESDQIRQLQIEELLKCTFIRVKGASSYDKK